MRHNIHLCPHPCLRLRLAASISSSFPSTASFCFSSYCSFLACGLNRTHFIFSGSLSFARPCGPPSVFPPRPIFAAASAGAAAASPLLLFSRFRDFQNDASSVESNFLPLFALCLSSRHPLLDIYLPPPLGRLPWSPYLLSLSYWSWQSAQVWWTRPPTSCFGPARGSVRRGPP